jgi:hypothetical protein
MNIKNMLVPVFVPHIIFDIDELDIVCDTIENFVTYLNTHLPTTCTGVHDYRQILGVLRSYHFRTRISR